MHDVLQLPEGPEPVAKEIRYLAREELEPVEDITAATSKMVGDLQSGDWSAVCDALTVTRQLAACHVESLRCDS